MVSFIKNRLSNKILGVIILAVMLILGAEILVRIYFGTQDRIALMHMTAQELAASTYAGMKYPMKVGDAQAIRNQLADIREVAEDVEVYISDFAKEVVYATHEDKVHQQLETIIRSEQALRVLDAVLDRGYEPPGVLEDRVDGQRYLLCFYPILNEKDCHHCHGASRLVLGSMSVRMSAGQAYGTVAAQRNRTLVLALAGIFLIVFTIYVVVNRFVRRPVTDLANKAERFAGGDTSVRIDVATEDEIGILGKTFNLMVENVSSSSKALEKEIKRKTALLDERTRLITLLEKANRQLRELDALKSTFLANMSHELRTPMNAIIGFTELLIDGVDGPINKDQEKSLKRVAANAGSLLQLINDILDISKIESGRVQLEPKELDLLWLVEAVMPTFEAVMKEKGLILKMRIAPDLPPVYGDEEAVRRVLINLISNAVKFTDAGDITVTARPSERGVAAGEAPIFAEVCVEDTGVGIEEKDLGTIFDKFVQADLTTVRQHEGTGLGLSIARGLIALHKGMMWAESTVGKGSRFCFTIPMRKEILDPSSEPVVEPRMAEALGEYFGKPPAVFLAEPKHPSGLKCWETVRCGQPTCPAYQAKESRCWLVLGTHCSGMKIASYPEKVDFCKGCEVIENLVREAELEEQEPQKTISARGEPETRKTILAIDDNLDHIDLIRKYLGDAYYVVGLIRADKAVEKAREVHPSVITLDIMMPSKDGWQVLSQLKQDRETQDIPVIIISIVDDKKRGFSLGAAEYIVKPMEKAALLQRISTLEKLGAIQRILVVDQDRSAVRFMSRILQEARYDVLTSYNSRDAVRAIQDHRPDLVIVSLTMPKAAGMHVFEYLKTAEAPKDTPVIVLTEKKLSREEVEALDGRVRAILNKRALSRERLLEDLKKTILRISHADRENQGDDSE